MERDNYWQLYFDAATVARSEALRQEFFVDTSDVRMHVDAYLRPNPSAPMVLLNHGEGGYARMLTGVALALYERGYSVLTPDQRGHGLSSGYQVDFTVPDLIEDVLDASHWARRSFSGPLFLAGIHGGSGLVYNASSLGAPVMGLICHHLYDFTDPSNALAISRFARLDDLPGGVSLATGVVRALTALSPRTQISMQKLANFSEMLDKRDNGRYEAWLEDPNPAQYISLRYAVSSFSTPSTVPFEENEMPVMVINPLRDKMILPEHTRGVYERLGGPKSYREIDAGHWSMLPEFNEAWADEADTWMKGLLEHKASE